MKSILDLEWNKAIDAAINQCRKTALSYRSWGDDDGLGSKYAKLFDNHIQNLEAIKK